MTKRQETRILKIITLNIGVMLLIFLLRIPSGLSGFLAGLSIGLSTRIK
jgi:hypothetical protein